MAVTTFGTTAQGRSVKRIAMAAGGLRAAVLTWGAVLQGVWLDGVAHSLTLGSDSLTDYEGKMRHHGALIAPVVNRLGGAQAPIAGVLHRFEANQDGAHTLHAGRAGTHLQVWDLVEASDSAVTLALTLPDGAGGFPGTRPLRATFSLHPPATLRLQITATTDRPTLFNAANHSYWNLDGSPLWAGHRLQVAADRYLPTTAAFTPTGEIAAVAGTAYDFRTAREIAPEGPPLDTCFCLADAPRGLTPVLTLTGASGVALQMATTDPGVQVYDGRNAIRPGRDFYEGLAIEAQNWPDAPNHAGFPGIELRPGQTYAQTTEWRFTAP